jgi:hypothetical protein
VRIEGSEATLEELSNCEERRRFPRYLVDLPLDYWERDDSCLHGGIVVNASEGGFLVESLRDIPVGKGINISVLFRKEYELANLKAAAVIVWKRPYSKRNSYWDGYLYGLRLVQIREEDRWKLDHLLGQGFNPEEAPGGR